MIPLRLVIDTNVVISAALKPEGLQRTVVLLAMTRPARWYVSDAIMSEYADATGRFLSRMTISSPPLAKVRYLLSRFFSSATLTLRMNNPRSWLL